LTFDLQDADPASLKSALEAALLTADEFVGGSSSWGQFSNPFLALDAADSSAGSGGA
jgi:hypothetical protein